MLIVFRLLYGKSNTRAAVFIPRALSPNAFVGALEFITIA